MMHSPTVKPVRLSHLWQAVLLIFPLALLGGAYAWISPGEVLYRGIVQLAFCLWFSILLFIGIAAGLRATFYKKGTLNFLIGDGGSYSLSRLQAAIWAVVIMASQFCQIFSLLFNKNGNLFRYYEPTFSDSAMWLLGLSLTSYVAVKSVTVNNMQQSQNPVNAFKTKAQWSDIISGPNGLDLSKCQMLVWTLLAICVFESKVYDFDFAVMHAKPEDYVKIALRMYDENKVREGDFGNVPYVPFLPWSFVVLMGLSQGVYVGKKLVPQFKLDELKAARQSQLEDTTAQLTLQKQYLGSILDNPNFDEDSQVDRFSAAALNKQITDLQQQIADINGDLNTINSYTKAY
ncbi:hypothetical protein [Mucilaginibacter sp. HD30]